MDLDVSLDAVGPDRAEVTQGTGVRLVVNVRHHVPTDRHTLLYRKTNIVVYII